MDMSAIRAGIALLMTFYQINSHRRLTSSYYDNICQLSMGLQLFFRSISVSYGHCCITWNEEECPLMVTELFQNL